MDHPLVLIFIIIIILDFILLLYFLAMKLNDDLRKTLQDTLSNRIKEVIHRQLHNPMQELNTMDRMVIFLMKDTIIEELMNERWLGTRVEDLKVLLQQWGYLGLLYRKVKSRKWWIKLESLHVISAFHLTSLKPSVKELLHDENPFVKAKAFRVLGTLGDIGDLQDMLFIIKEYDNERYRLDLMVSLLEKLEIEGEDENLSYLRGLYDESEDVLTQTVLLHLIASKFKHKSLPFLKDQLKDKNSKRLIAAIKSMVRAGLFPKEELTGMTESNFVDVQSEALKALSFMKNRNNIEIFEKHLLHSDSWVLKYYASFGLAMLGVEGVDRLEALKIKQEDELQTAKPFIHYFIQILQEEGYVWETLKRSLKNS